MTPPDFEELRMLARWSGDDPEGIAAAAAGTLVSFSRDPAGLVVACRRLVDHHRDAAAMWWLAACLLGTNDPAGVADECARHLERSPSLAKLVEGLPFPAERPVGTVGATDALRQSLRSRPDLEVLDLSDAASGEVTNHISHVLIEVQASDGATALLAADAAGLARRNTVSTVTWAVVRVGRYLPEPLFRAFRAAQGVSHGDSASPVHDTGAATAALASFDAVVGPRGCGTPQRVLGRPLCGAPPELLRPFA